jgi:hypothetical protein
VIAGIAASVTTLDVKPEALSTMAAMNAMGANAKHPMAASKKMNRTIRKKASQSSAGVAGGI